MRVAILGMDGLEYHLVRRFDMRNLIQEECSKIDLSEFEKIITPPIWASFLTGLPPEGHKIREMYRWESRLLQGLSETSVGTRWFKRVLSSPKWKLLGFRKIYPTVRDKGIKTMFDRVSESVALDVPTYNRTLDRYLANLRKAALKNPSVFGKRFENCVYNRFIKERRRFMKVFAKGDWNLIMGYTLMPDYLGHNYRGNLTKMWEAYAILDDFVGEVRVSAEENVHILIISDHGMDLFGQTIYGDHSDHGFYSSNKILGLRKPKMTDFFRIILEEVSCNVKD